MSWDARLIATILVLAACSNGSVESTALTPSTVPTTLPSPSTTIAPPTTTTAPTPAGEAVGSLSAFEGGRASLTVPLDHDDPDGPTIQVPVWRRRASDPAQRIGVLFVNPGGPGQPAGFLVRRAIVAYTSDLRDHFDIVALDPRGTFPETEADCLYDLTDYISSVDWTPDAPGEVEAVDEAIQSRVDTCEERFSDVLAHVSTMDTVHDMALLVEALGEEQVSYLGFSYGTVLGAAFATAYPELVRAAVFDGAYHPYGDPLEELLTRVAADEALFVRILKECDTSADCPMAGGAQEAFARVSARADEVPLESEASLPEMNQEAFLFTILAGAVAYGGPSAPLLSAVAAADAGNPIPLQRLYVGAAAFQSSGGSLLAIRCLDYRYRGETPYPDNLGELIEEAAPTLTAVFPTSDEGLEIPGECERWPTGPELLPIPLSGEEAGPVLVVTATGDSVTPTGSAESLSRELVNDTLVIVEDDNHVSYRGPQGNEARACATDLIDAFLIQLVAPADGTVCGG